MTTETDLRRAMEGLASEGCEAAALEERIRAAVRTPRASRVSLSLSTAAAVVVVLVTIAVAAFSYRGQSNDNTTGQITGPTADHPCATASTPLLPIPQIGPVADLNATSLSANVCAGFSQRSLYTATGGWVGVLTLFAPGVFDTSTFSTARPVQGAGIHGYVLDVPFGGQYTASCPRTTSSPDLVILSGCDRVSGLAWRYAPNAVATISPINSGGVVSRGFYGNNQVAKELAIAAAVRPSSVVDLRIPFRIKDLAGLKPLTASEDADNVHANSYGAGAGSLELAVPGAGRHCATSTACEPAVRINVQSTVSTSGAPPAGNQRSILVGTERATIGTEGPSANLTLRLLHDHWSVMVEAEPGEKVSQQELVKIVRGLKLAPSTKDTKTWFPLRDALPN